MYVDKEEVVHVPVDQSNYARKEYDLHVTIEVTDDGILVSQSKITVPQVFPISWARTRGIELTAIIKVVTHMRRYVTSQPDLHPSFPVLHQLNL